MVLPALLVLNGHSPSCEDHEVQEDPDAVQLAIIKLADFFCVNRTTFKDRLEVTGSVLAQFDQVLKFLAKHMRYKTIFVNMRRVDYEDFPLDAVREALINAISHRDYEVAAPPHAHQCWRIAWGSRCMAGLQSRFR